MTEAAPTDARQRDADIVATLARGGREPAFEQLVQRYEHKLYRLCLTLLREPAAAEDATQDSLLRVWRALASFDPARAALSTWLYAITRHHCLGLLGRPVLRGLSLSEPAVQAEAEAVAQPGSGQLDHGDTLRRMVATLPEAQRCCLTLYYQEERAVAEVAAMLGLPEGSVKTHLHRGRARLLDHLRQQGLDDPALWLS